MRTATIKRVVKHTLSSFEINEYHKSLVCSMRARDTAEVEFEDIKAKHKKHTSDLELEIDKYRMGCERGWEDRQVDCTVELSRSEGKKRFYRLDTSEYVGTEEMTDYDRQLTIRETEEHPHEPDEAIGQSLTLWEASEDKGLLHIVYKKNTALWFYGLSLKIGDHKAEMSWAESTVGFRERQDAVKMGSKMALKWIKQVAPDALDGFKASINAIVEAEKGKVE